MQLKQTTSSVLATTKQETDIYDRWPWVEASVWTKPMLTALENSVKGGKWFSLMGKVCQFSIGANTLAARYAEFSLYNR